MAKGSWQAEVSLSHCDGKSSGRILPPSISVVMNEQARNHQVEDKTAQLRRRRLDLPLVVGSVFCVFEISRIGGGESHPTLHVVRVPPGLQSRVSHSRMANKAKGLLWFGRKVSFAKGTESNDLLLLNDSNGLSIGTLPRAVALDNLYVATNQKLAQP